MADTFAQLIKSRNAQFALLNEEVNKIANKTAGKQDDSDIFWKPTVDKAGNGMAIIRFLPAPKGEDLPFVRVWNHSFQGPTGSWYINDSLTTIGLQDPVAELNARLWNSGNEDDKNIARKQKRKLTYIANIRVEKDAANPSNEGKVFLFKFGKKIFDKLNEAMNPQFEDEKPMNPFDPLEGAPFKLKIRQVDGYRNYDKSEFGSPEPISENEKEIETIWLQEHSLKQFIDPSRFKTYEELKAKLDQVLGKSSGPSKASAKKEDDTAPWEEKPAKKENKKLSIDDDTDDLDALLENIGDN